MEVAIFKSIERSNNIDFVFFNIYNIYTYMSSLIEDFTDFC